MKDVVFHRLAQRELTEAAQFYEDRSEGLGLVFGDYVWKSLDLLRLHSESAPILRKVAGIVVRKRALAKFPYNLLFSVEESGLFVLAVAHQKRRPSYWIDRIHDLH